MAKRRLIVGANSFVAAKLISLLDGELIGLINKSDFRIDYTKYIKVYNSLNELLINEDSFDTIFHIGAFVPFGQFDSPNKQYVLSNIDLVSSISSKYAQAKIIFFSSVSVYGLNEKFPLTVDSCFNKPSLYGLSKIAGESIIKNHKKFVILRISSIWGKGIETDTFLPRLINQAKNNNKITLFGEGLRKQNYIHWIDLIQIAKKAEHLKENSVLLAADNKSYSNLFIAKIVANELKVPIEFIDLPESQNMIFNAEETYKILNFTPNKRIDKDIKELL